MSRSAGVQGSLIGRFVALMLVITLVGIVLVAAFSLYEHSVDARKKAQNVALDRALTVLDATETAATAESLSRFIFSTAAQPSIRAIALLNTRDEVVLASKRAWQGQSASSLTGTPLSPWLNLPTGEQAHSHWDKTNRQAIVIAPVEPINPAASIVRDLAGGRLIVALDARTYIENGRAEAWFDATWAGSILLLLVVILARILHRRVALPLQRLSLKARRPEEASGHTEDIMPFAIPEIQVLDQAVDELMATRRALDAEKSRLSDIADTMPGAVYEYRYHKDTDDEFTFFSAGILPLLGIQDLTHSPETPGEISQMFWSRILPEDWPILEKATEEANQSPPQEWEGEFRIETGEDIRWIWGHAVPVSDSLPGQLFRGVLLDITPRKRLEQRLKEAATHDPLTGALNRAGMKPQLEASLAGAHRHGQPLAVAIFDIDHFKHINDTYGHPVGDTILRELVNLIGNRLRGSDSLGRWGGEEFLLLLPQTDPAGACQVAETLRQAVEGHKFSHGEPMTISLGVASARPDDDEIELVRRADDHLYQAKALGRNRVVVAHTNVDDGLAC